MKNLDDEKVLMGSALASKDPVVRFWQLILPFLKKEADDFELAKELSPETFALYLIIEFDREIINGGFDQYFINPSGKNTIQLSEALKTIGATFSSNLLDQSIRVFPQNFPFENHEIREDFIRKNEHLIPYFSDLTDQYYKNVRSHKKMHSKEEDLWFLCEQFIKVNENKAILA